MQEEGSRVHTIRENIFREPRGGKRYWIVALAGCWFVIETIFFQEGALNRLVYLFFGLALLCLSAAELAPGDRTKFASTLRIGFAVAMLLALVARIAEAAA
ncbi:hypothetical protein RxyAA322_22940 [Rubrobacter xylanophilus]|uniref:Uncharacterized protein n=1 Tax=Rubrobacter xylanophilus TaxID=49319 RepID=A0A510HK94_9ACTN|nr:hypothetical protein [Rubrobacter xylanophilus]BBL80440.1 hypothetical protein RxyAA322_22940 [Rubrobacter xylanophilus]